MLPEEYEIMAPVGSWESLASALKAEAGSIYFGVEALNMRAGSASRFTLDDLPVIVSRCKEVGTKAYLTVNTIIYDEEIELMHSICRTAKEAGISAIIASDAATLNYCHEIGVEVHLSTQLNISNTDALKFYANFADVTVLARELNLSQVSTIHQNIQQQNICGPRGEQIRIEMFCHGALCMAVSGKCYLSLDNLGHSANRGSCLQVCRRGYTVRDRETDVELDVDNKYIMSPKDLCTIGFIDQMITAGVRVFKIEGRARSAEYVYTTVTCYKEAIQSVLDGTFSKEKVDDWTQRLSTVFNRGFWDGYYLGQKMGEWSAQYGSSATEHKEYVAKGVKYFSKLGVAEFLMEAGSIKTGDNLLIIGPTTGAIYLTAEDIRVDEKTVAQAAKGESISIKVPEKIRPSDKLYKLVKN